MASWQVTQENYEKIGEARTLIDEVINSAQPVSAVKGVGQVATGQGNPISVSWAGLQPAAGDLAVVVAQVSSSGYVQTVPSGWTRLPDSFHLSHVRIETLTHVCSGSETGSVSFTTNYGKWMAALILLAGAGAVDGQASLAGTPATGVDIDAPSVDTQGGHMLNAFAMVHYGHDAAASALDWPTVPIGTTPLFSVEYPGSNAYGLLVCHSAVGVGATQVKTAASNYAAVSYKCSKTVVFS